MTEILSAPQAKAASRRLEHIRRLHVPFATTLQEHEWYTQAGLMETMRERNWRFALLQKLSNEQCQGLTGHSYCQAFEQRQWAGLSVSKRSVMANYTGYVDQAIQNARLPYAAHAAAPPMPADPYSVLLVSFFDEGPRVWETEPDAQNALLVTTLALRAYRLDHGTFPVALPALVPGYLKAVPDDPFALSGPLHYKLTAHGYLLYSVGPDGKDDGDTPITDAPKRATQTGTETHARGLVTADSQGDLVAGMKLAWKDGQSQ